MKLHNKILFVLIALLISSVIMLSLFIVMIEFVHYPNPGYYIQQNLIYKHDYNLLVNPESETIKNFTDLYLKVYLDSGVTPEEFVDLYWFSDYDWDNWGVVDYFETPDEALLKGHERYSEYSPYTLSGDCEDIAIFKMSLNKRLKSLGYIKEETLFKEQFRHVYIERGNVSSGYILDQPSKQDWFDLLKNSNIFKRTILSLNNYLRNLPAIMICLFVLFNILLILLFRYTFNYVYYYLYDIQDFKDIENSVNFKVIKHK